MPDVDGFATTDQCGKSINILYLSKSTNLIQKCTFFVMHLNIFLINDFTLHLKKKKTTTIIICHTFIFSVLWHSDPKTEEL